MENATAAQPAAETIAEVKYTRAQALEEGLLMDITELAKNFGIKIPTAVTVDVFVHCILAETKEGEPDHQEMSDRLVTMLLSFTSALLKEPDLGKAAEVTLHGQLGEEPHQPIQAKLHGGDEGEPVMTFMFPIPTENVPKTEL